jgi:hypothetical protein
MPDIPGLRRAASKAKKLERENDSLRRELAFVKAGVDVSDPKMGYFVRGYEGDTTPDAIRAAAVEAGFIQPPQASEPQGPDPVAQRRIEEATLGAPPAPNPMAGDGEAQLEQAMAEGGVAAMLAKAQELGIPVVQ